MPRKPRPTIYLTSTLAVEDLAEQIVSATDQDALFSLIVLLDEQVQDWDFTERLFKHFASLIEQMKREVAQEKL